MNFVLITEMYIFRSNSSLTGRRSNKHCVHRTKEQLVNVHSLLFIVNSSMLIILGSILMYNIRTKKQLHK